MATISAEKSRSVKLQIESGKLVLSVRNMEAGQAVEEVEIDYDEEPFEIGFNARYLLDVCGQIAGETMELRFADPALPNPGARPDRSRRSLRSDAAARLTRRRPLTTTASGRFAPLS